MKTYLFFICLAFTSHCYPQKRDYTPKVMLAIETYAFLKGQNAALEKVSLQFPEFKDDVIAIENSSKIFQRAEQNIESFLRDELGNSKLNLIKNKIDSLSKAQLQAPIQDKKYAHDFLEKVKNKIHLSEDEYIPRGIFSFAYHDVPHQEVIDGHTINFTTKNHPKAKEAVVKLTIPKSWSVEEAELPNTIQQFTSYDGRGIEKILIVVHNLSSKGDELVLNEKSVFRMIPPESRLIRTEDIVIDGKPGIMVEIEEILNYANEKMKIRMMQFMFAHNQKLYCLQGSIGPSKANNNLDRHLKQYEPLFRLIVNGTKIID
ncbi:hypothetical protein [Flavobacterium sp. 3-210]